MLEMANRNSIMVDLDDPRVAHIATAMSSKSARKILGLLSEKEMSASDIAFELKMPLNTVGYNLDRLIDSGLVLTTKKFFWSEKGKKVLFYRVADKKIIISPKWKGSSVIPAAIGIALIAGLIKFLTFDFTQNSSGKMQAFDESGGAGSDLALETGMGNSLYDAVSNASNVWAWFFVGGMTALIIFVLWNWGKENKK